MNDTYSTILYQPPLVAGIFFEIIGTKLHVILLRNRNQTGWTVPCGPINPHETSLDALHRVCLAGAGIRIDRDMHYIEQLYTFDATQYHPPQLAIAYSGYSRNIAWHKGNSETLPVPFSNLPKKLSAFDKKLLAYAYERLQAKLSYTSAIYAFLPPTFTLGDLQLAYEAIYYKKFDKRNFRKKYLALGVIKETGATKRIGTKRPAQLYQFKSPALQILPRPFM